MSLRDIIQAVEDKVGAGDLIISNEDDKNLDDKNSNCPICGKITKIFTCYSWFILNDKDYPDFLEMLFCSKECWKKFLKKEIKRL